MSMILSVTGAIVSKGYDDQPAIRFSEKGDFARFRFSCSKYDKNAANNKRWINMAAKAFGDECQRIRKMQLKEGSYINLVGEYDEETWVDPNTQEQKTASVLTLLHIEYAGGGTKQATQATTKPTPESLPKDGTMPESFEGYEAFGSAHNPYFPEKV